MKNALAALFFCVLSLTSAYSQNFNKYFTNQTLRIDYIFAGDSKSQTIVRDGLMKTEGWAGRRTKLNQTPLAGDGRLVVRLLNDTATIYTTSFSSLFQEWLVTEEALENSRAFENTFLIPYPKQPVEVEVILFDTHRKHLARAIHKVFPDDILIKEHKADKMNPHRYLLKNGTPEEMIDVAILAEGYKEEEMNIFYRDASTAVNSIFTHEPFASMKNRFNVVAVASPSADSGVSIPHKSEWKETAFGSHFDTFYSERYLTTNRVKRIHDALSGIPYEHIIILANTEQYGGGGIYNAFTLTTAHHPLFQPVVVHEFGHSFAGLADEYFYDDEPRDDTYNLRVEPWEPNITTLAAFELKWKDMLLPHTPIPTSVSERTKYPVGVFEGAGYHSKGIYRGAYDCRMRTNGYPDFCPVCRHAIERVILFYTHTED